VFDYLQEHVFLCLLQNFQTGYGPTQPPIQWTPDVLSLWVNWWKCEIDHSFPSSAEVRNEWSYASIPPIFLHVVKTDEFIGTCGAMSSTAQALGLWVEMLF
jgi:hypothetical protein